MKLHLVNLMSGRVISVHRTFAGAALADRKLQPKENNSYVPTKVTYSYGSDLSDREKEIYLYALNAVSKR